MRLISAANTLTPAFGGAVQRLARKGSRFALDITVPALKQAGCGMSLITDLTLGEVETIVAAIPEGRAAADYGAPLVVGAGHAGTSLPIDGLLADVVVPKGKFLSIIMAGRRYVHLVTAEATASAGGEATLAIWPMLRRPPADNDVVELATPMIEGFIEPGQGWSISRLDAVGVSFTIEERA
jgi:hypothetical protein